MTRRDLQELVIANYPSRSVETALDRVKRQHRNPLAVFTDSAIDKIARELGEQRRIANRMTAKNLLRVREGTTT